MISDATKKAQMKYLTKIKRCEIIFTQKELNLYALIKQKSAEQGLTISSFIKRILTEKLYNNYTT